MDFLKPLDCLHHCSSQKRNKSKHQSSSVKPYRQSFSPIGAIAAAELVFIG
jgi:hypothetical protein